MAHAPVLDRSTTRPSPPPRRDPAWVRPALLALLVATGGLYLWQLSSSGYANSYYAAAIQAGSQSWKAWFFGALDAASSITVDKPPASLWLPGLLARVVGFNSWTLLIPQALEGVAAVGLLFAAVRRVAGPVAGLAAGALLALTPAAVLIFRFDNPDALLLLLVVAATYCVTRALEDGRTKWLALAGVALGFGFLTKSGQALLVLPALSLAYLALGPNGVWKRVRQLLLAGVTLVVSAGWWILAVLLWPAADRPYIGGSTDNNPLELAFGYNGLGRLFGGSGNMSGGGGGQNSSFGGSTGLQRMFSGEFGLEISWLLPAALVAIAALFWVTRSAPRTDRLRAAALVWGGSLLATGLTFSFMQGTIHPYYSVALAPAIAALVAIAGRELWVRNSAACHALLIAMVVATSAWGVHLLTTGGTPTVYVVVAIALGVAATLGLMTRWLAGGSVRRGLPALALVGVLAVAAPIADWGLRTANTPHTGSIPTAVSDSSSSSSSNAMGGGMGGGGTKPSGTKPSGTKASGTRPSGNPPSRSGSSSSGSSSSSSSSGSSSRPSGGGGGGTTSVSSRLAKALESTTTTWSAATVGAQNAASYELATGTSVIGIGGFSGSDDAPTLAQFKAWVKEGKITYFIASSGQGGGGGSSSVGTQITNWVKSNFTATTIGGTTVYDLTT
ncbi:phospholipid carrier-dependent glycosyltransferase [Nocardioides mangrovicus]|uniref:Phospholipid carrier-dependent glycosyltransferase n=1 Tax=Nocardioides mangrovicus TaxID=2478913 RepID=A0A3L8P5B1_9ACTN|nr:glycosyltransferase family 39 protein [Nocardioides mangrovicus]RLV50576.1 phospholipid carrier-dependent glycosyltransferase [Nocardioides mangrovicus]